MLLVAFETKSLYTVRQKESNCLEPTKMNNSLLTTRDISYKYMVLERGKKKMNEILQSLYDRKSMRVYEEKTFAYQCGKNTFEDWTKAFCKRKYNSDFSREMTRSVGKYLTQFESK